MVSTVANDAVAARRGYYDRMGKHDMAPLWETLQALVTPHPNSPAVPHIWHYDDVRPFLMEAGELITAREAERRVLILQNPGMGGEAAITRSLYAGLQLVMPGDVAPAHRHSQNALRLIVEGSNAFTAVNGEKTLMNPGDLVITPAWHWHDHGNDTDQPMVWMDALDIPLVSFFDASFAEAGNAEAQEATRPVGDSDMRFGNNLAPVDWKPASQSSPIFNYPYARTRETLAAMAANGAPDAYHGHKLRYVNPASGGHVTPTIAAFVQLLSAGSGTESYRSTDATVFSVVEGEGESRIGDTRVRWKPRDIFVVPSWVPVVHKADEDAVLFSYSDRAAQERLGLWREGRGRA
jgi:gentisate 1,2-dioxygenase